FQLASRAPLDPAQFLEGGVERVPDLGGESGADDAAVLARPFEAGGDGGGIVAVEEEVAFDVALHRVAILRRKARRRAGGLEERFPFVAVAVPGRGQERDPR